MRTVSAGEFTIHHRVGNSAMPAVNLDGYQYYQSWDAPNSPIPEIQGAQGHRPGVNQKYD
jgi:hypothetical protein